MKLLALDTSSDACSVALAIDGHIIESHQELPRQQAKLLLSFIDSIFAQADLKLADLDAIAFGQGPGSFTGLRIACSTAQALAYAADKPLIPISTLRAMAQGAYRLYQAQHVLVALDARMQEVYWGAYKLNEAGLMQAVIDEQVCAPIQCQLPQSGSWRAIGSAWSVYQTSLEQRCGQLITEQLTFDYPHAYDIALLATEELKQGNTITAFEAKPVYLRNKVTS